MNIPLADQSREGENSPYGEAVRLSNEVRPIPAHRDIETGLWVPAKQGVHIETDGFPRFMILLASGKLDNPSLTWCVLRAMAWRFPTKYAEIKNRLNAINKNEFDLIVSNIRHEFEWLGETGLQNKVRYDGRLNNPNVRSVKNRDGSFKSVRI